ncbi:MULTISPECIES: alpha/beta hydrolase family protein [unclassified Nonomuraea]|uniref:alpha/beta hydrolase family protein n=1 Tax=unclassified Nonomuraea TaxID=2593643 RepID=UPI001376EA67|nr:MULTISPECIES: carboxylic ester hydrolase [unclassified Nonomuraea]NBE98462.1 carboxylic ester hydrolase [Nonomuraea sp. K271]
MRPFEIGLVVADLLALLVLAVPPLRRARHVAPLAALAAVAQVLVEGARVPLVPAYVLAAALTAAWAWRMLRPPVPTWAGRLGVGLCAMGLVPAMALPMLLPVLRFPPPAGPHGIGTLTYHWTDAGRQEILGPDPAARRELMVQIWYPARRDPSAPRTPYVEDPGVTTAVARLAGVPDATFGHMRQSTGNAVAAAPAAPGRHPVLVFLEGAQGFRQMNTFQVEALVSHGYVVVAVDQPYAAGSVRFPDGRSIAGLPRERLMPLVDQSLKPAATAPVLNGRPLPDGMIPHLARDVTFTLDRVAGLDRADPRGILTGRLDLRRTGVLGISLGGIVTAQACAREPRLRACLIMDAPMPAGVVRDGIEQPAMWLTRDAATMRREGWDEAEVQRHQSTMRGLYDKLPGAGYFVLMPDTYHGDYTDAPLWSPLMRAAGLAGPIGAERAHSIINAYTLAFFDRHLKEAPAALLDGEPPFPGVRFESRR